MQNRRIVVTGIGMLTPLGLTREACYQQAMLGQSSITAAPEGITRMLPNALSANIDPAYTQFVSKNENGLDKATQFAVIASREAIADAQIENWQLAADRIGVFTGIGLGGASTLDALYTRYHEQQLKAGSEGRSPTVVHPLAVPRLMPNASSAAISMDNGFQGPTHTYSVACASSAFALGEAYRNILHGYSDAMVVVGTEAMTNPGCFIAWNALRVMAKPYPGDPAASCRPFDRERSGFVIGEGATALVLETAESAISRGAHIYGEICGYGSSSDAGHLTLPSREGQCRAMHLALKSAGMQPEAIDYLNAHGTATDAGDVIETESIQDVFGAHARRMPVSSTKSMHGHLIGAAGAVEFALSLIGMDRGVILPTANLDNPDERCTLDYVPKLARTGQTINTIMSNSFAFGGSNVSLIARKLSI